MTLCASLEAQNTLNAYIKDSETKEALTGATALLLNTSNGVSADINGFVILSNIPDGKQAVQFSFIGYEERTDTINFPLSDTLVIYHIINS